MPVIMYGAQFPLTSTYEPRPEPNLTVTAPASPPPYGLPSVLSEVLIDVLNRHQQGVKKFGGPMVADRDRLRDAYEEAIDLVMYLKSEIMRRAREGVK